VKVVTVDEMRRIEVASDAAGHFLLFPLNGGKGRGRGRSSSPWTAPVAWTMAVVHWKR
jgi:hypothetical protein